MTSEQISEWEAYNRLEPIGDYRRDLGIAILTSTFYNFAQSFGSKEKRLSAKPQDFMPWMDEGDKSRKSSEEQSVEEMKAAMLAFASSKSLGKEDKPKVAAPYPYPPNWYRRHGKPVPENLRES
jgi:hypothetical protein